jgi:FkbM family methyltransferase
MLLSDARLFQLRAAGRLAALRAIPLYQRTRTAENIARHVLKRPHDTDYACLAELAGPGELFLDVGANCGVSAVSFRIFNQSSSIVSIEANPIHREDLRFAGRLVKPYRFAVVGVGASEGEATLHVPMYNGVQITPLASFREQNFADWRMRLLFGDGFDAGALDYARVPVAVRTVDSLGLSPAVVKIDVEGHEPAVLDGMSRTLGEVRPALLAEWSREWAQVQERLDRYDYVACVRTDRGMERLDPSNKGLNVFCLPAEHPLAPV